MLSENSKICISLFTIQSEAIKPGIKLSVRIELGKINLEALKEEKFNCTV